MDETAPPPGPRFRRDLVPRVVERDGVPQVEVFDPATGNRFALYDFEHATALAFDGRPLAAVALDVRERCGLDLSPEQLAAFAAHLGELGFLEPPPASAAPFEPAAAAAPGSLDRPPRRPRPALLRAAAAGLVAGAILAGAAYAVVAGDETRLPRVTVVDVAVGRIRTFWPAHAPLVAGPGGAARVRFAIGGRDRELVRRRPLCRVEARGALASCRVLDDDDEGVAVEIAPPLPAEPGAVARLLRDEHVDAVLLPIDALGRGGASDHVLAVGRADRLEVRPVEVAFRDATSAIVVQGLDGGDRVAIAVPAGVRPGDRIASEAGSP